LQPEITQQYPTLSLSVDISSRIEKPNGFGHLCRNRTGIEQPCQMSNDNEDLERLSRRLPRCRRSTQDFPNVYKQLRGN